MPPRIKNTLDTEKQLAANITKYRKQRGLTYEGLADRMKTAGCEIHFSGIQKSEKSGRRITVEELAAYSIALDIPVLDLLGLGATDAAAQQGVSDFYAATRVQQIGLMITNQYWEMIHPLREQAAGNSELRTQIQERLDQETAYIRDQYSKPGQDMDAPEIMAHASAALITARDILEGSTDGGS